MTDINDLIHQRCKPCEGGVPPLSSQRVAELLKEVPGWVLAGDGAIERPFNFSNHYETMAFVNAVAWISHGQNHHPDMEVGYNRCKVRYLTHAIGGLSENDFICAARVNGLVV